MPTDDVKKLGKEILDILEKYGELEFQDVTIEADELVLKIATSVAAMAPPPIRAMVPGAVPTAAPPVKPFEFIEEEFKPPIQEYPGQIVEVQFGQTRAEGGTRKEIRKIGGEKVPPFYRFEYDNPNRPLITFDVFDMRMRLPKPIRQHFDEVMDDPAEWAKKSIYEYGADLVTVHLISTDPYIKDTPAKEAAKTIEEVLQAIPTPLLIGGSGNPDKDPEVLEAAAAAAENERLMLNSASDNLDWKRIVEAAKKYNHNVLSWTQLDVNDQKKMNQLILEAGLPKDHIVQDATTAALGYGFEYSFSIYERIRMAALKGEEWGSINFRGPLWEAITGLGLALNGCDIFMMLHPASVQIFKTVVEYLTSKKKEEPPPLLNWITTRI